MARLFLLISHTLSPEQINDARISLGVSEIIKFDKELMAKWMNIPPKISDLSEYLAEFREALLSCKAGDFILIQGEFGATYHMVNYAKSIGLKPIHATTAKDSKELIQDGVTKKFPYLNILDLGSIDGNFKRDDRAYRDFRLCYNCFCIFCDDWNFC
ncbi:MAG: hypothetical protein IKC25_02000 [Campylobacter sp.]|nr:hypothetical protein [Campylobacter sp.]